MPIALAFLRRAWPYLLGAAAVLGAYLWIDSKGFSRGAASRDAEVAALSKTIADVRLQTAKARADDLDHARTVEAAQDAKRKDAANAYETELAAARGSLADYAARLRAASNADPGSGGGTDLPGTAQPAGAAAGAGDPSVLADLEACTVNTVKAEAWRDWWLSVVR